MTEPILVAIIGASGIVVGSLLAVFVTYMTTKAQNSSRTNELRLQFEHERKEKQIARLIEKRAPYLNHIGQHLQSITKSAHFIEKRLRDLVFMCGSDDIIAWADPRSPVVLYDITNSIKAISGDMDGIEMLRIQITDSRLLTLIRDTLVLGGNASKELQKLGEMRIKHAEGHVGDEPNKEISYQCTHILNLTIKLFESIRESNRQIEEILSGIE